MIAVELKQQVAVGFLVARLEAGGGVGEQVVERLILVQPQHHALVVGGQESAVPVFGAVAGVTAVIWKHHESGQIVVQATQPVADPGTHAREARILEASGLQVGGLAVDACLAGHVVDEGHLVHDLAE